MRGTKLLNYTTEVAPEKTAAEIQVLLGLKGAQRVTVEYAKGTGIPLGITFAIETAQGILPFRLPIRTEACYQAMRQNSAIPLRFKTRKQAERVAWRIAKTWLEAQMALVETAMAPLEEIFFPYLLVSPDTTVFMLASDEGFKRLLPSAAQ